ncbi:MAG: hypothetical protein LBG86_00055 [Puniceicoccales bacterium]|jgi:hypothetical protein|nr:hypothetical protein [Puniceicoccales bacterium]
MMTLINDIYGQHGKKRQRTFFLWELLKKKRHSKIGKNDLLIAEYAPPNEYVVLRHGENKHVHGDPTGGYRPLEVRFLEPETRHWNNFVRFLLTSSVAVAMVVGTVYFVQRHAPSTITYATASVAQNGTHLQSRAIPIAIRPRDVGHELTVPVRVSVSRQKTNQLRELTAGTLSDQIQALDVRGVQVAAYTARALIGNRVVHQGDHLYVGNRELVFRGVEREELIFEDEAGQIYHRNLHPISMSPTH